MKWTVVWSDHAIHNSPIIWLDAVDRKAITAISRKIDVLLREGPFEVGEEREPPERVLMRSHWLSCTKCMKRIFSST